MSTNLIGSSRRTVRDATNAFQNDGEGKDGKNTEAAHLKVAPT